MTVRQWLTPSASAASRRLLGTCSSTPWLDRAISGSITIASATEPAKPVSLCNGLTSRPNTNRPTTIVGIPWSRSSAVLSVAANRERGGANSVRYSAHSTPIGSAIAVATPTTIVVPTIADAIPPPGPPNGGGSFVRNEMLSELAPRAITPIVKITSTDAAANAEAVAPRVTRRLTAWRRRRFPDAVSGAVGSNRSLIAPAPWTRRTDGRSPARPGWSTR